MKIEGIGAADLRDKLARSHRSAMHGIQVSVASPEAADYGVAELSAGGKPIGYTILRDGDLMLQIEPRTDHAAVVVGARSLAQALTRACHLLEQD